LGQLAQRSGSAAVQAEQNAQPAFAQAVLLGPAVLQQAQAVARPAEGGQGLHGREAILSTMFVAAGEHAGKFCEAVERLGERAEPLGDGLPVGPQLLHLEAAVLFGTDEGAGLLRFLDEARQQGALVSIDLGPAGAIRDHGGSRTAYQLARIQPDILFASQESAQELGAPLEGVGLVPVLMLGSEGCSVYGHRIVAPATGDVDPVAFMAAFCVAFVDGAAPVEAVGRAILVGALSPR
jgi:hypothetical protein